MPDGWKHCIGTYLRRLCRWLVLGPYQIPNLGHAVMLFPWLDALRQRNTKALSFARKTGFEEPAAVCAGASLFVGNDSGTGHVAGACGVPTVLVAMFQQGGAATHHSSPLRTHPAGPLVRVVQAPCQISPCRDEDEMDYAHCILGVIADAVCGAVDAVLGANDRVLARAAG